MVRYLREEQVIPAIRIRGLLDSLEVLDVMDVLDILEVLDILDIIKAIRNSLKLACSGAKLPEECLIQKYNTEIFGACLLF